MIAHLFKYIWNQKKRNFLVLLEIFFSFLVLFAVSSLVIYHYQVYQQPTGFEYQDVWVIEMDWKDIKREEFFATLPELKKRVAGFQEVEYASFSRANSPYSNSTNTTTIHRGKQGIDTDNFGVDEDYASAMQIPVMEGRWFSAADTVGGSSGIVINQSLKEELFPKEKAIGRKVSIHETEHSIVGVVGNYKYRGVLMQDRSGFFYLPPQKHFFPSNLLIKVKPGVAADFEAKMVKSLNAIAPDWAFEVEYLKDKQQDVRLQVLLPIIIFLVICGFLVLNVALGLFGVLWYNINLRKGEIGVRRAMGATYGDITFQFVGEILVLATLSIILGLFFAIQFPLLSVFDVSMSVYLGGISLSIVLIYLLVIACALYPSTQAATIQPAEALHED